jgi:hypothetical protein
LAHGAALVAGCIRQSSWLQWFTAAAAADGGAGGGGAVDPMFNFVLRLDAAVLLLLLLLLLLQLLLLLLLLLLPQVLVGLGSSKSGRKSIASAMKLCPAVQLATMADVLQLRGWLASAW